MEAAKGSQERLFAGGAPRLAGAEGNAREGAVLDTRSVWAAARRLLSLWGGGTSLIPRISGRRPAASERIRRLLAAPKEAPWTKDL